jgi:DNA-binding transcriptional regulator YiaG
VAKYLFISTQADYKISYLKCKRNYKHTAPVLGAIQFGFYILSVTKSVFTKRYKLFLSLLISLREEKGLSQRDLAKKLKKIHTFVSKYERGERRLDVIEFLDIAKALGANPHKIIDKLLK